MEAGWWEQWGVQKRGEPDKRKGGDWDQEFVASSGGQLTQSRILQTECCKRIVACAHRARGPLNNSCEPVPFS